MKVMRHQPFVILGPREKPRDTAQRNAWCSRADRPACHPHVKTLLLLASIIDELAVSFWSPVRRCSSLPTARCKSVGEPQKPEFPPKVAERIRPVYIYTRSNATGSFLDDPCPRLNNTLHVENPAFFHNNDCAEAQLIRVSVTVCGKHQAVMIGFEEVYPLFALRNPEKLELPLAIRGVVHNQRSGAAFIVGGE